VRPRDGSARRSGTRSVALERDPTSCERAQDLIDFVAGYAVLERDEQAFGPYDFDHVVAALRAHAKACSRCSVDWVRLLFRMKRAPLGDDRPRRICCLADAELPALTGVATDEALWAWLGQHAMPTS
jgi:hypothetical protein